MAKYQAMTQDMGTPEVRDHDNEEVHNSAPPWADLLHLLGAIVGLIELKLLHSPNRLIVLSVCGFPSQKNLYPFVISCNELSSANLVSLSAAMSMLYSSAAISAIHVSDLITLYTTSITIVAPFPLCNISSKIASLFFLMPGVTFLACVAPVY